MMMGFSNLHVRIPTSPIDSVAIVVLDCVVVVVEVERVVDSTSRRPWAIPVDFAVVVVVVVVIIIIIIIIIICIVAVLLMPQLLLLLLLLLLLFSLFFGGSSSSSPSPIHVCGPPPHPAAAVGG